MPLPPLDPHRLRADFPALARLHDGQPVIYADAPGGTQVPRTVTAAMTAYLETSNANFGGMFATSRETGELTAQARAGVMHLLNGLHEAAVCFGLRLPELFCGFERAAGEAPVAYPVACLPQAWAAGAVFMMLQACLGIQIDGATSTVCIEQPRLPDGIESMQVRRLQVGSGSIDLTFRRLDARVVAFSEQRDGDREIRVILKL